jgi:hypothetical protein
MTGTDELLDGAVDLYVHANPDLVPRRHDDVGLARELAAAGLAAAVHRNHFTDTTSRAAAASEATGFRLMGALVLNSPAGGLDPGVAEAGLRRGAVWLGMPTLSAPHFQAGVHLLPHFNPRQSATARAASEAAVGACEPVLATDPDGTPLPAFHDICRLVREHDAVLSLGYYTFPEVMGLTRAALDHRVERIVLSNPYSPAMRMSTADAHAVLSLHPGIWLEVSLTQTARPGGGHALPRWDRLAETIGRMPRERVLISSDGGTAESLSPPELLAWGCHRLRKLGFTADHVRRFIAVNPAALLGLS